jgi:hypothetical protein
VTTPPDPQQPGGYAYNPYAVPARPAQPNPPSEPPAGRPVIVIAAVVLLILGAVPLVLVGALLLLGGEQVRGSITPELLGQTGLTVEQIITLLRVIGAVALALGLLHIGFAGTALMGRQWGRVVATVTAALVAVVLVIIPIGLGIALAALVAVVVGAVLLYVGPARGYFANPRR